MWGVSGTGLHSFSRRAHFPNLYVFYVFRAAPKTGPRGRHCSRDLDVRTPHTAPDVILPTLLPEAVSRPCSRVSSWALFRSAFLQPGALEHMVSIVSASARHPFVTGFNKEEEGGGGG